MRYWRQTTLIQQTAAIAAAVGMLLPVVAAFLLLVFYIDVTALTVTGIALILLSIALFICDMALKRVRKALMLRRLLHQMYDPLRRKRLLAVEELRKLGWLKDGSLAGVDLSEVDLQGANLGGAVMRGANLRDANLRGADLHWADLTGADLTGVSLMGANLVWVNLTDARGIGHEQFSSLYLLRRAILPDGKWYDGRYNLLGDINDAARDRVKTSSIEDMARWYEVSPETYHQGQLWAEQNPDIVQVQPSLSLTA